MKHKKYNCVHTSCVIALSLFLEELDKSVDAQQKDMKKRVPKWRVRVIGESADSHPPSVATLIRTYIGSKCIHSDNIM